MPTRPAPHRTRPRRALLALAAVGFGLVAVGCSAPAPSQPDLSQALVDSGLSRKVADCTAKALKSSLTDSQLDQIAERGGGGAPVDDTTVTNDSADKLAKAMTTCRDLAVSAAGTTTTIAPEVTLPVDGSTTTLVDPDAAQFNTTTTTAAP